MLLTVGADMAVERAVQFIKGGLSFRASRELGFCGAIWQRGFSEIRVPDEAAYRSQSKYIRNNPVRAHIVDSPEQYRFCSAYPEYDLDPRPQGLSARIKMSVLP